MVSKSELTQEYLQECFSYDESSGVLSWNYRPQSHFTTSRGYKIFSKSFAGKPAGYRSQDGYINVELDGVAYRIHILIWFLVKGEMPKFVDHENGVRDDNRIVNLRNVEKADNARNAKRRSDNTSGVTGVTWMKRLRKWQVSINFNGTSFYIGVFADFYEAVKARKEAEEFYGYHKNHGRD